MKDFRQFFEDHGAIILLVLFCVIAITFFTFLFGARYLRKMRRRLRSSKH